MTIPLLSADWQEEYSSVFGIEELGRVGVRLKYPPGAVTIKVYLAVHEAPVVTRKKKLKLSSGKLR